MAERTSAGPIMQVVRSEVQKLLRGWRRQVGDRAEAGHRRIPRCAIDALESRQLLSTLYIDGPTSASDTTITITQTEGTPETGPVFEVNGAASIAIDQNPSFIPQGIWTTPVSLYADGRIEVRMYGGNDTVTCSGDITVTTVVYGGAGNDSITTMGGNDSLYGEGGNDSLVGDGGSDLLDGGEGNDELHAGGGNDILLGGAGDDRLTGALGDNQLEGGAGDDLYVFVQIGIPAENDTIVEAAGASGGGDTLSFETMDAAIAVNLKGVASPGGGFWVATVPQRSILVQAQADAGNLENVIASTCGEAETNFIVGNAGTTSVSGGDGRDYVDCLASNLGVAFIGGAGDDSITTGSGNDTLWGGTGNDTLNGDGGNDSVVGEEGDDVLRGSGGSDTLWGGTGNDSLIGTLGNDSITGDEGNDTVLAGGGDDALDGGTGNDLLDGGGGYDLYTFGSYYVANEADTVNEAVGDTGGVDTLLLVGQVNVDLATAYADRKIAWGPSGTRTIYRSASTAVGEIENIIAGTCGPTEINTLTGGIRTMKVTGGDGRDSIDCSASTRGVTVLGGAGNDTITGSAHDDLLSGGDGDDWISGGTGGDDTLVGDYGYDTLVGGVGSDVYRFANGPGSSEQDRVEEEASNVGTDVLDFSPATEGVAVDLSQATPVVTMAYRTFVFSGRVENITGSKTGTNSLTAGPGATMVIGGEANDTISCANAGRAVFVAGYGGNDTITGSSYDDRLDGGDGNDSITGGAGNDLLLGGGGDDRLMGDDMAGGDSGADVLIGGSGADYLNGGNGADTPLAGSGNGTDTLDGGLGADTLNGQNGNDAVISGGDPNDSIVSSAGADLQPDLDVPVPTGGASGVATDRKAVIDRSGQTTGDAITVTRSADGQRLYIQINGDAATYYDLTGAQGLLSLTILAGSGNDTITVNSDVTLGVTINGGDGSDTIRGGGGNDGIMGKGKADLILGGTGVDTVDGGAGDDVFASRDDLLDNICGLREHYVSNSTGGDDANTGIYGAPWRKIEHALQMAVPGDTIRIYGTGIVYELGLETHVQIDKPNLTLEGYDSAAQGFVRPQIRLDYTLGHVDEAGHGNSTVEVGPAADNTRLRYLDISGGYFALKTFNTGFQDIYIENPEDLEAPDYRVGEGATGLLIEECWLHGSAEDVVKLTPGCDSAVIRSSRIFDSGLWWRDGHASSGVGENAEGIDAVNVDGAIVEHNEIYQTLTNGVYFKGGSRDTLINANFVHHAGYLATEGYSGIVVGQDTDLWFFDREVGNDELYESVDAVVRNNIVADCGGAGVLVWAALNARILNNTLVRVAGTNRAGIQVVSQDHEVIEFVDEDMITRVVNRPSTNATIQNNIIDLTDRSGRPVISIAYPTGLDSGMPTFSNNLYYVDEVTGVYFEDQRPYSDSPYHPYATYAYDTSEDRWEGSGATDSSLWFGDADSIVAAPAFASADPQVAADYRLATGSPCIGAGEYLIATVPDDYLGEARSDPFDIGAYRA